MSVPASSSRSYPHSRPIATDPANAPPSSQNAALRGATLAFRAQGADPERPKPSPRALTAARDNGALLAATQASREHYPTSRSRSPSATRAGIAKHATGPPTHDALRSGGRDGERELGTPRLPRYNSSPANSPYLAPPGARSADRTSFIAATLAASRSASPSPSHTGQGTPAMRPSPGRSPTSTLKRVSMGVEGMGPPDFTLDLPDTSSIAPTNSLISMFEGRGEEDIDPVKKTDPSPRRKQKPALRPPTPPRTLSPRPESRHQPRPSNERDVEAQVQPQQTTAKPRPRPKPKPKPRPASIDTTAPLQVVRQEVPEILSPRPRRVTLTPDLEPASPASRTQDFTAKPVPKVTGLKPKQLFPNPPSDGAGVKVTRPLPEPRPASQDSTNSDDTFVSASSTNTPRAQSPSPSMDRGAPLSRTLTTKEGYPAKKPPPPKPSAHRRASSIPDSRNSSPTQSLLKRPTAITMSSHPGSSSSGMGNSNSNNNRGAPLALDSLTDAIMAGSLASARLTPSINSARASPAPPAVPPPRRSQHHHGLPLLPHHSGKSVESPRRTGMLQTLRQPLSQSDDEDFKRHAHKHRKKVLGGKKHTHHEGARRRWREEVTERERRRYEAVWASNRGLYLKPGFVFDGGAAGEGWDAQVEASRATEGEDADLVANVAVRDIWGRSRLPADELAEVWELVDRGEEHGRRRGALTRQEFVVGMWLIDQRLRGRKIPARVTESVWNSARGALGVTVPKAK